MSLMRCDKCVCQTVGADQVGRQSLSRTSQPKGLLTQADITIMGGDLFKKVASVARLHKRDFKRPDKVPVTYNNQQFQLDAQMDLDIAFGETTIRTPVYLKMDTQEQLLLSEGVCSQLGLVTYHPGVASTHVQDSATEDRGQTKLAQIPIVSVQLLQTTSVLPHSVARAEVRIQQNGPYPGHLLVEGDRSLKSTLGVDLVDALLEPSGDGTASVLLTNTSRFTCRVEAGSTIGTATEVSILKPAAPAGDTIAYVCMVPPPGEVPAASGEKSRKEKLLEIVLPKLPEVEKEKLRYMTRKT